MSKETIYIQPASEEYTGFATYVFTGTSTSELEYYSQRPEIEYLFPESREELFMDDDLREFYRKKGY